ncbi:hypothetical protein M885DRAFT_334986 [Pelagophyceae sp. CCMP2097]|nr:hypothetical protein M885DRAFT_334986 [Pelagophyceae sp. CCMP2097]
MHCRRAARQPQGQHAPRTPAAAHERRGGAAPPAHGAGGDIWRPTARRLRAANDLGRPAASGAGRRRAAPRHFAAARRGRRRHAQRPRDAVLLFPRRVCARRLARLRRGDAVAAVLAAVLAVPAVRPVAVLGGALAALALAGGAPTFSRKDHFRRCESTPRRRRRTLRRSTRSTPSARRKSLQTCRCTSAHPRETPPPTREPAAAAACAAAAVPRHRAGRGGWRHAPWRTAAPHHATPTAWHLHHTASPPYGTTRHYRLGTTPQTLEPPPPRGHATARRARCRQAAARQLAAWRPIPRRRPGQCGSGRRAGAARPPRAR